MRKAFTMVELIFVIVILGILAAVAIPRLAATRDDASVVAAAQDLSIAITDIAAYRITGVEFAKTIPEMTNVQTPIIVQGKKCAIFSVDKNCTAVTITKNLTDVICKRVWDTANLTAVKQFYTAEDKIILE